MTVMALFVDDRLFACLDFLGLAVQSRVLLYRRQARARKRHKDSCCLTENHTLSS